VANGPSAVHHLLVQVDDNKIEHSRDTANTLASTVSFNSSHEHYSKSFKKSRVQLEKRPFNFDSDYSEYYHELFSLLELQDALHQCHDTAVGPDEIHHQMLKHLPDTTLSSLFHIFNESGKLVASHFRVWKRPSFLYRKPDKDHTSPNNYRPIALTSCLCNSFNRMVNHRLTWYLESSNTLTELQSGFRRV
jgi:hypothetical protein